MIGVLGPTGQVGVPLMRALDRAGATVRALAHSAESARRLAEGSAEVVRGDVGERIDLDRFLDGVDRLFLLTAGAPDQTRVQDQVVDAAVAAGVGSVVKLSVYTAADDCPCSLSRWHAANDAHIARSGLAFTILHPHTFMQSVALQFAPAVRAGNVLAAAVRPDARITMVDARDVAEVAAAVLLQDTHRGETVLVTGPEALSYADCAALIGTALGRRVDYVRIGSEQMSAALARGGLPPWLVDALVALQGMYDTGELAPHSDAVERLTGRAPRTFARYVEDHVQLFA